MFQNNLIVSFLIAVLMTACSEGAQVHEPRETTSVQPVKVAAPAQAAPTPVQPDPAAAVQAELERAVVDLRVRGIAKRLVEHRAEVEAAFASGDCELIDAKRDLVEECPGQCQEVRTPGVVCDSARNTRVICHPALEEWDRQYRFLGCHIRDICRSQHEFQVTASGGSLNLTVEPGEEEKKHACIHLVNKVGPRLQGVRLGIRITSRSSERFVPEINFHEPDTLMGRAGESPILVVASELPKWLLAHFEVDCLGAQDNDPFCSGEGSQDPSGEVHFTLTVTPVLAPEGSVDARECANVRNARGEPLSEELCLGRLPGGHFVGDGPNRRCSMCAEPAAERNAPHPPSGEPDCPGPRCESPRPLSDAPNDGPGGVHSL